MNKNIPLILLIAGMVTALIIISGCSTEDPWDPNVQTDLVLSIVSGPADTVAYGASITFTWTSHGGLGEVEYRFRLASESWADNWSNATSAGYDNVTAGDTFEVMARDDNGEVSALSVSYEVGEAAGMDTTPPTVWITQSPFEGSYIATGSSVTFAWDGSDDMDMDNILFQYSYDGYTSEQTTARTVTFADVESADPADFEVWCYDQSGNEADHVMMSFVVRDATILYIDDYQWHASDGGVDLPKERDQKQFYRDALEGYAFAEWDIAMQGLPDSASLVSGGVPVFSTILFAGDADVGSSSGTWWWDIGSTDNDNPIHYYMASGGNLIATGPEILPDIWYNTNPPQVGDFEYKYLGVSDQPGELIDEITTWYWLDGDSTTVPILFPDSITTVTTYFDAAWYNEWWLTWVIKDAGTFLDLPDSMKVDVAKNGAQDDYATAVISLRNDDDVQTEVLFRWGLWVDGSAPAAPYYENPIGYICRLSTTDQWTAVLHFDTYAMPLPAIQQTFGSLLTQFGE